MNPIPFHPLDEKSILACIGNSDLVINLVGNYRRTKNLYLRVNHTHSSFSPDSKTSHRLPRASRSNLQRAVQDASSPRVGSAAKPPSWFGVGSLEGNSAFPFQESANNGEEVLREVLPSACIVRPADRFGEDDRLLTRSNRGEGVIGRIGRQLPIDWWLLISAEEAL